MTSGATVIAWDSSAHEILRAKAASGDVDAPDDLDRLKLPEEMFEVGPHDPFVPSIGTRAAVPPNR